MLKVGCIEKTSFQPRQAAFFFGLLRGLQGIAIPATILPTGFGQFEFWI
jgi:hypothetical protein